MKYFTATVLTGTLALLSTTASALPLELVYRAHHQARNAMPSPYASAEPVAYANPEPVPEVPKTNPVLRDDQNPDGSDRVYYYEPPPISTRATRRLRARATAAAIAAVLENELEQRDLELQERDADAYAEAYADRYPSDGSPDDGEPEEDNGDEIYDGRRLERLKRAVEREEKRDEYIRSFRFHRRKVDLDDSY